MKEPVPVSQTASENSVDLENSKLSCWSFFLVFSCLKVEE